MCTVNGCKAEGLHWFNPPLCERHWEIVLLVSRAERHGLAVSPSTIATLKRESVVKWQVKDHEIPQLLAEIQGVPA